MLLLGQTDEEGGNVDHLLADGDVSLSDEDAGMMCRLGELPLGDLGLQAALEELGGSESQHVIELELVGAQQAKAVETSDQGLTYCTEINLASQML